MSPENDLSHVELKGRQNVGPTSLAKVAENPAVVADSHLTIRAIKATAQVLLYLMFHPPNGCNEDRLVAKVQAGRTARIVQNVFLVESRPLLVHPVRGLAADVRQHVERRSERPSALLAFVDHRVATFRGGRGCGLCGAGQSSGRVDI